MDYARIRLIPDATLTTAEATEAIAEVREIRESLILAAGGDQVPALTKSPPSRRARSAGPVGAAFFKKRCGAARIAAAGRLVVGVGLTPRRNHG